MTSRVLFLGHSGALSGAELFLSGMLAHAREVDPVVVLLQDGPLRLRLEEQGVRVVLCPMPGSLLDVAKRSLGGLSGAAESAAALPSFARELSRTVRDLEPDLLYTNSAKAHVVGIPLARALRVPSVMHVHNGIATHTYGRPNRVALHAASQLADLVLVNSRATQATLRPGPRRDAALIYCPTEVPERRVAPPGPDVPLRIALAGRIVAWKGQDLAVASVQRLLDLHGPGTVSLDIYGDALFPRDREYRDRVQAEASAQGLDDAVRWHGHVDDVPGAMRSHDVVIHTSITPEPMGQVIVEAMAAGRPVVAARAGGPLELVDHDRTGLLYPMGEVSGLVAALNRLIADPELRERLGCAAHVAAGRFSYDTVLPAWEELLTSAADARIARAGGFRRRGDHGLGRSRS